MHLKELNHRSPMRIFERSVHGGLARGGLGLVAARAGVGKNAFLTGMALDHLLRDQKVLHVALKQTVEHVRQRYDEIFASLARSSNLEEQSLAREAMERNRIIRSLIGHEFDLERFIKTVATLQSYAEFKPDTIILSGLDFEDDRTHGQVREVLEIARGLDARLWMPVRVHRLRPDENWREIPPAIRPLEDVPSVIVRLQPLKNSIRIRILKNRDEEELPDLDLELDPTTLLVRAG